jgi:lipopolysaccharide/colanic/teichoic acid biosynthesis glycosyltransferase
MYQPVGSLVGPAFLAYSDVGRRVPPHSSVRCPIKGWDRRTKRIIDVSVSLILIAALLLPMLVAMLLIRLETSGPALFRQYRIGFRNTGFGMWKLRTMHQLASDDGRLVQATRDDPRVTRVGRWLRRWSIDELPQLLNVLSGEMSLVGPRPHAPGTCAGATPFELVTPQYSIRHRVLPGITGLAQVRGLRGETDTERKLLQRVAADLEYIEHWSLWLDVKILTRTAISLFATHGAY